MAQIVTATANGKIIINGREGSIGLGDTIAKMTTAIGIKPCGGCKKRQDILNKKVPYKKKALSTEYTEKAKAERSK